MKALIFLSLVSVILFSCKSSKHAGCDAYSNIDVKEDAYTLKMAELNQSEDVKFIRENWSKEEIDNFAKNFVYKTLIINGDTLK